LWVFIYGLILIYIFTLVAFAIHRDIFDPKTGHFCDTFYQCMVTSLRKGLIDGLYDVSMGQGGGVYIRWADGSMGLGKGCTSMVCAWVQVGGTLLLCNYWVRVEGYTLYL